MRAALAGWPTVLNWPLRAVVLGLLAFALTLAIVAPGPSAHEDARRPVARQVHRPAPAAVAAVPRSKSVLRRLAAGLDAQIAAPWPKLQTPVGRFRNMLGGGTRYGEATLGYALLQAGARAHDRAQIHTGLRALAFAIHQSRAHARPSVFENLALAAAYNLARRSLRRDPVFQRARPRWEQFLRSRQFKELNSTHNYDNHFIADAVATLELLRSGLTSTDPTTVVGNPTAALAAVEQLVNVRIPQLAGANGVDVQGQRTFVLSDPPDNPLSYQGLSLGLYARALKLLGARATDAARQTLVDATQASWWLTAPDGDLGWYGRSDEESWGLAATAYGAVSAANLSSVAPSRARDFRALAERALTHLRSYGVERRGLNITPAVRKGHGYAARGLDSSAGGPSFTGITLMMLNWSLPDVRGRAHSSGRIGADRDAGVQLASPAARLAIVRHGDVWFGLRLKAAPTRANDLRYDFGLHLLEVHGPRGWVDVVGVRPQPGVAPSQPRTPALAVPGTVAPDSAGPALKQPDGSLGIPYGDSAVTRADGTVDVTGGWRSAGGAIMRSGVTFSFAPISNGLRMTFPRLPGDRIEYSVFVPGVNPPKRRKHSVSGPGLVASWSGRARVKLQPGYASADEPHITRARLTFAPAPGPVHLKLTAP